MKRVRGFGSAAGLGAIVLLLCLALPFGASAASAATNLTLYAYAAGTDSPTSGVCTSTADDCSLTAAVNEANGDTGDTIYLEDSATYATPPPITSTMTIEAAPEVTPVLSGGVDIESGSVTLQEVTVLGSSNSIIDGSGGTVRVVASTVTGGGNGIQETGTGELAVTDSSISGEADGIQQANGDVTVTSSTFSGAEEGIANLGTSATPMTTQITLSTFVHNTGFDFFPGPGFQADLDIAGDVFGDTCYPGTKDIDEGYNVFAPAAEACAGNGTGDATGSFVSTDFSASPAYNGGPTETVLPANDPGNLAIIPGNTTAFGETLCPTTDQRGALGTPECYPGAVQDPNPTLTIGPEQSPQTIAYGASPDLTPSYNGFILDQDASSLGSPATCAVYPSGTTSTSGATPVTTSPLPPGSYAVVCSGAANNTTDTEQSPDTNYAFSYEAGTLTVNPVTPSLSTTPSPTSAVAGTATLTDTASISGGYSPTGSVIFTLLDPNKKTLDTEKVPVNGNGTYSTPRGFVLASSAPPGTYQWDATFIATDSSDKSVTDNGAMDEQVSVQPPVPQQITFTSHPPDPDVTWRTYTVSASGGGSGNPVTFSIDPSSTSSCSIENSTTPNEATVKLGNTAGSCVIDASQAGGNGYEAATAQQSVTVVPGVYLDFDGSISKYFVGYVNAGSLTMTTRRGAIQSLTGTIGVALVNTGGSLSATVDIHRVSSGYSGTITFSGDGLSTVAHVHTSSLRRETDGLVDGNASGSNRNRPYTLTWTL